MSERTLGKARGLNSIADPADFKGSRGRRRPEAEATPPPPRPEDRSPANTDQVADERTTVDARTDDAPPARPGVRRPGGGEPQIVPAAARSSTVPAAQPAPHRAVVPGVRRKRRELSIPLPVADALESTGINPADVVMSAYRTHGDAIYAGAGGRMVSRGRRRLRLSISDAEFDKINRLGEARGWNRSETVAVLLAMELLTEPVSTPD